MKDQASRPSYYRIELGIDRRAKLLDSQSAFYLPAGITKRYDTKAALDRGLSRHKTRYRLDSYAQLKTMDRVEFRIFDLKHLELGYDPEVENGVDDSPSTRIRKRDLKLFSISCESARVRQLENPFDCVCVATYFKKHKHKKYSLVFGKKLPAFSIKFPHGKFLRLKNEGFFDVRYSLQTGLHHLPFVHDPEWIIDTGG